MEISGAKAAVDKEWKKLESIPAWQLDKVKSKKEVILEAQRDKTKVHFASLMDSHLKNAELQPASLKFQGQVTLRGDEVKDDSRAHAAFTEQGSSASHMTAAKSHGCHLKTTRLWWTSSWRRFSVRSGKDGGRSQIASRNAKSGCPEIWMRLPRHKWLNLWLIIEDPVVLPERNLYGHPLGLLWEWLILIWTSCKKNAWMTAGMSIRTEVCQIIGKDSQNSLTPIERKNRPRDICGPGGERQV